MSGEGSSQVGNALSVVMQFRLGRVLLWILATPFLLVGSLGMLTYTWGSHYGRISLGLFFIGALTALFPIIGAWRAYRESRPSPIRWFLLWLALAGMVLGGAMLLTWLLSRRSRAALAPPPAPPRPEDVDRLCADQELMR